MAKGHRQDTVSLLATHFQSVFVEHKKKSTLLNRTGGQMSDMLK